MDVESFKMVKPGYILIFSGVLVLYLVFAVTCTDRAVEREGVKFNEANIDGVVERVGVRYHLTSFRMKNSSVEYVFFPCEDCSVVNGKTFELLVSPGDSVFKPAFSDTLVLWKEETKRIYKLLKR